MNEDEIPQPAPDPYSPGDRVRIYLGPGDPDERYHGEVCEVLEVFRDDLDCETDRSLDSYSYLLQRIDSGTELPVPFRHFDLVPPADDL